MNKITDLIIQKAAHISSCVSRSTKPQTEMNTLTTTHASTVHTSLLSSSPHSHCLNLLGSIDPHSLILSGDLDLDGLGLLGLRRRQLLHGHREHAILAHGGEGTALARV